MLRQVLMRRTRKDNDASHVGIKWGEKARKRRRKQRLYLLQTRSLKKVKDMYTFVIPPSPPQPLISARLVPHFIYHQFPLTRLWQ